VTTADIRAETSRNARLIAAAPELLAALESLVAELQAERPCSDVLRESLIPEALRAIEAAKWKNTGGGHPPLDHKQTYRRKHMLSEEMKKEAAERGAEWGRQEAQLASDQGIAPAWKFGRYCGEFPAACREEYEAILEAAAKAAYDAAMTEVL